MAIRMSQREFDALSAPVKKVPRCRSNRKRVEPSKPRKESALEASFARAILGIDGVPLPVREFQFHETRKWRFDFAWPEAKVAVEVEGGTWNGGRHTRGTGFDADCEKYAEATIAGWSVLRITGKHIRNGRAVEWLLSLLEQSDRLS